MPVTPITFTEYEQLSGLQRGQLWDCLTDREQSRLVQMGYRPRHYLTAGQREYLMEVFPLPSSPTELMSMSRYEEKCGFSKGELLELLSEEQRAHIRRLGYRPFKKLPFRVILFLKSLGYY